jgi:hypothetical protein
MDAENDPLSFAKIRIFSKHWTSLSFAKILNLRKTIDFPASSQYSRSDFQSVLLGGIPVGPH